MTLAVDVAAEGVRVPIARARVAELVRGVLRAERVRHAMISVAFLDDRDIARLNWRHLRHRGPTDVISFGLTGAPDGPVVGDIYIAPGVVRANAHANGRPVREELARVVVHGVLHVLGHDHPEGEERLASPMWRRQERLLTRLAGAARA
jgi:probable rRNA maturation factor